MSSNVLNLNVTITTTAIVSTGNVVELSGTIGTKNNTPSAVRITSSNVTSTLQSIIAAVGLMRRRLSIGVSYCNFSTLSEAPLIVLASNSTDDNITVASTRIQFLPTKDGSVYGATVVLCGTGPRGVMLRPMIHLDKLQVSASMRLPLCGSTT